MQEPAPGSRLPHLLAVSGLVLSLACLKGSGSLQSWSESSGFYPPPWLEILPTVLALVFSLLSVGAAMAAWSSGRLRAVAGGAGCLGLVLSGVLFLAAIPFASLRPREVDLTSPGGKHRVFLRRFSFMFAGRLLVLGHTLRSGASWRERLLDLDLLDDHRVTTMRWSGDGDRLGVYYTDYVPKEREYLHSGYDFSREKAISSPPADPGQVVPDLGSGSAGAWAELEAGMSASGAAVVDVRNLFSRGG